LCFYHRLHVSNKKLKGFKSFILIGWNNGKKQQKKKDDVLKFVLLRQRIERKIFNAEAVPFFLIKIDSSLMVNSFSSFIPF